MNNRIQIAIERMDEQVIALTGIGQLTINELRFETAYTFLQTVIGADEYGMEMLPKTPQFWNWWMNEWLRVDEQYMARLCYDHRMNEHYIVLPGRREVSAHTNRLRLKHWLSLHDANSDNYPVNRATVERTYHQMIKKQTKKKVKQ